MELLIITAFILWIFDDRKFLSKDEAKAPAIDKEDDDFFLG